MGILGVDIDKINLDDDNNFSRQTFAWCNKFENRKERKKRYEQRINACRMAPYKMVGLMHAR